MEDLFSTSPSGAAGMVGLEAIYSCTLLNGAHVQGQDAVEIYGCSSKGLERPKWTRCWAVPFQTYMLMLTSTNWKFIAVSSQNVFTYPALCIPTSLLQIQEDTLELTGKRQHSPEWVFYQVNNWLDLNLKQESHRGLTGLFPQSLQLHNCQQTELV